MKKILVFLVLLLFVCLPIFSQQPILKDVVYLKNGEKYIGEIVLKNEKIIMIQLNDGKRYQLQTVEISEIKKEEILPEQKKTEINFDEYFGGIFIINGGFSSIQETAHFSPSLDLSLSYGIKKILDKKIYLGAGVGIETIFGNKERGMVGFFPLFLHIKNTFSENNICPAVNIKLGYALPLQKSYSGGYFLNTSAGINITTGRKSSTYIGFYTKLQSTYGEITETLPMGTYTSKNNGVITTIGISTAFAF